MIFLPRLAAFLCFALSAFTLIHPRRGWGRLALFIPKLFAGSFIFPIGVLGLASATAGWLLSRDIASLSLGLAAALIASRHILRIFTRSLRTGQEVEKMYPVPGGKPPETMLPLPWVIGWRERADITWQKDVLIGEHTETGDPILADLWGPPAAEPRSGLGIIYLHGSGWHYASKDFGTRHFFRHLARQGHVILDVAYTLAPKADLFGMVADVKRAIDWMKKQARELGINAEHIVLMGGSAGGHLALLAGYTPNHPRLDPPDVHGDTSVMGVVSYYGPPDLRAQFDRFNELPGLTGRTKTERAMMTALEARFGFEALPVHSLLPKFMGGTPAEIPELYDLGSPCKHIGKDCPPTLLLQGSHDFSGAAPEVRKLHAALKEAGCRAFLLEIPDAEHGFDLYRPGWSPAAQGATYVTDRFLAYLNSHGGDKEGIQS
jgi:acetyl esterase/lipase